ncbi:MAG: T9SS type A sorting domain-containing protein [Bacteroidota bacterium]
MIRWFSLAVAGLLLSPLASGQACTHTWLGGDGHFNDDASWDAGLAPGENDVACITAPGTYTVSLSDVRSESERSRFGAERMLAGLVVGGESGTQTLQMTEAGFGDEGYEELGVDELVIQETGRFEMPGGALLDGTQLTTQGVVMLGGPGTPEWKTITVENTGQIQLLAGQIPFGGRWVNHVEGETRWVEPGAELVLGSVAEFLNRGLVASRAEEDATRNYLGRGSGTFVNEAGRLEVESGTMMVLVENGYLTGGTYDVASDALLRLEAGPGDFTTPDGFRVSGMLSGDPNGEMLINGIVASDGGATLDFNGRGVRIQESVVGDVTNTGVLPGFSGVSEGSLFTNRGQIHLDTRILAEGEFVNEPDGVVSFRSSDLPLGAVAHLTTRFEGSIVNRGAMVAETGIRNRIAGNFVNKDGRLEALTASLEVQATASRLERGTYLASQGHVLDLNVTLLTASGVLQGGGEGTVLLSFPTSVPQAQGVVAVFDFSGRGLHVQRGVFSGSWINLGRMTHSGGGIGRGVFENRGVLEWRGTMSLTDAFLRNESGATLIIPVDGSFQQSGSLITNRGLIVKSGGEGTTTLEPVVVNAEGGEIRASSGTLAFRTLTDEPGARYSGTGTLAPPSAFAVSGTIAPGDSTRAPGVLTWAGPLLASSSFALDVDLNGSAPGTEHDQLVVDGDASLAGTLHASVSSAFSPEVGTSFEVLRTSSLAGSFASSVLAEGLEFRTGAASVEIAVVAPVSTESGSDVALRTELAILGNPSHQPVVRITVPNETAVAAEILDVRGRRVAQLFGPTLPRGRHEAPIQGLAAGVYVVRASIGEESFVRQLTVAR